MSNLTWSEQDAKAVDTARVLAADAVEKVGNGHPGTAISLAPIAYLLYAKVMNVDPNEPRWLGRDRFVMSAGHSSMTQYAQLYLNGFGLELNDIESLRTWGSLTPGHPEFGLTKGVECTTGPLGAGVSSLAFQRQPGDRHRLISQVLLGWCGFWWFAQTLAILDGWGGQLLAGYHVFTDTGYSAIHPVFGLLIAATTGFGPAQ